jgi:sulfide dehydrogenase [flavocytochrome c] flavoprotein subunit
LRPKDVIHVASVHAYDAGMKTMLVVPGAGCVSVAASGLEDVYAMDWARMVWADSLL